jgi:hypothetical protein
MLAGADRSRGTSDAPREHVLRGIALLCVSAAFAPRDATGWIDGYRAISRELPAGQVDVASFGLVELTPDDTPAMRALHVRLVIANQSDRAPWAFDARTTQLEVGDWRERATFANSDRATLPVVILERGDSALVDLYFALPARCDLASFAVAWQLSTGQGMRTERTRFVVDHTPSATAAITHHAGWGPRWWFDPAHEWSSFYRHDGIITPRPPSHVLVTRPPSRHQPARTS